MIQNRPMLHTTQQLDTNTVVHRWQPEEQAQVRGAVVLQHGFGEYAERYLTSQHALTEHLLERGFEVWALDLWGHGRSPGKRGVCHVGRAVADHHQVLRLAAATGLPVSAMGHSLGGLVTAASAATYEGPLAAVVLLGAALPDPMPPLGRRALGLAAKLLPTVQIPRRRGSVNELSHRPEVVEQAVADPRMYDGQIGFLLATTALDTTEVLRLASSRWSTPCLLLHGTADTYTDAAGSRDLAARLGSHATLHLVKDGYHELLSDTDGDDVLQRTLAFLEAHQPVA